MTWKKNIIQKYPTGEVMRFEWVHHGRMKFVIDVNQDKVQGFPASNRVSVFAPDYGGWVLGTPRAFKTKKEVSGFVSYAKKQLLKGRYGKKVPFPK